MVTNVTDSGHQVSSLDKNMNRRIILSSSMLSCRNLVSQAVSLCHVK